VYRSGEWFWIDSNGKIGTKHRESYFGSKFPAIRNHCEYNGQRSHNVKYFEKFLRFFEKNNHSWYNFQNSIPKVFIATLIDVLCPNLLKFGWWEISEIVRYLPDKKQQNFAWLSSCRYCTPKICPGPAPNSVLRVLQISSKSVHGVLAKHAGIAKTCNKVNPIFGWSLSSSRIITKCHCTKSDDKPKQVDKGRHHLQGGPKKYTPTCFTLMVLKM